jgi:hypothetical protein
MSGNTSTDETRGQGGAGVFGSFLVGRGVRSPPQLDEALQSHSVYGGRLGTNLVELGYLALDELATHLAAYHEVPMPPIEWLEHPDPKALKLAPMRCVPRRRSSRSECARSPRGPRRGRVRAADPRPEEGTWRLSYQPSVR